MISIDLSFSAAGAATGFLVGLTGVGGGALMTPLLLLFFGVAPQAAVGTDLWFAAITKLVAVKLHNDHGLVDWQVARRLWSGSLPAALITLLAMNTLEFGHKTQGVLVSMIGAAVLLTAMGMLFQPLLHAEGKEFRLTQMQRFKALQPSLTIVFGMLLGVLVTLTSVGAGALGAVALTYLYPLRLSPAKLVATDIVHAIPLALMAGLGHLAMGHVDVSLLISLLVGSIPAVILGACFARLLSQAALRSAIAVVLTLVAMKILWQR